MTARPARNPISTSPRTEKSRREPGAPPVVAAPGFPVVSTTAIGSDSHFFDRRDGILGRRGTTSSQRDLAHEPGDHEPQDRQDGGDQEDRVRPGDDRLP